MKQKKKAHIIDGKKIARGIERRLKRDAAKFYHRTGMQPGLGILLVGDDPASHLYVSIKMSHARSIGLYCKKVLLPKNASEQSVIRHLQKLQNNPRIHGVIIQIPLPKTISLDRVCASIDPKKDIDCLHPLNLTALSNGKKPVFWPPTAESVAHLIAVAKVPLRGKKIAIVGRGFFSRQIAALCTAKKAKVTLIASSMIQKKSALQSADIIISAVGKPRIIKGDYIKKGAVVIDVGTAKVEGRTVGDVDVKTVVTVAGAVSPVPGGVGPVTVAILMKNVLQSAKQLTETI